MQYSDYSGSLGTRGPITHCAADRLSDFWFYFSVPCFPRWSNNRNFRKIIVDKYIKGCVLLSSSRTSTEYLNHSILSDSPSLWLPAVKCWNAQWNQDLKKEIPRCTGNCSRILQWTEWGKWHLQSTCSPRNILLLSSTCTPPLISAGRMFSECW